MKKIRTHYVDDFMVDTNRAVDIWPGGQVPAGCENVKVVEVTTWLVEGTGKAANKLRAWLKKEGE